MTAGPEPVGTRPPDPSQPLGDLVSGLTETLGRLMRQEVALARAETKQEMGSAMRGAGLLVGGAVFAVVALILLSLAIAQWLAEYMALGWAYLIVGLAWVVVAAVLVAVGRRQVKDVNPMPERTAQTVREIPQAMRGNPS